MRVSTASERWLIANWRSLLLWPEPHQQALTTGSSRHVDEAEKTCMPPPIYRGQKTARNPPRASEKVRWTREPRIVLVPLPTNPIKEGAMTHARSKFHEC